MAENSSAAIEFLVEKLKQESYGHVSSKLILPGPQEYTTVAFLNVSSDKEYLTLKTPSELSRLFEGLNIPGSWGEEEHLGRVPLGSVEDKVLTIELPVITDRFAAGPFRFGKKAERLPYRVGVVSFQKSGWSEISYLARAEKDDNIGGHLSVGIYVSAPDNLADMFMSHAEGHPNDVMKILSDGLFPRLFENEHEYKVEEHQDDVIRARPIGIGRRGGEMYFRNLSPDELQRKGFEFGTPYFSMKNELWKTMSDMFREYEKTGQEGVMEMMKTSPSANTAYNVLTELQKLGIKVQPQPPVFAELTGQKSIINPKKLHYTPS
ncbi:hypothetical protein HYU40_04310 [Candidatus Woesearchaeota archaeon]|nr:hypothetical protein [Candidatus Woesearchaeota archaeon]